MKNTSLFRKLIVKILNLLLVLDRGKANSKIQFVTKAESDSRKVKYIVIWATFSVNGYLPESERIFLLTLRNSLDCEILVVLNTKNEIANWDGDELNVLRRRNLGRDLAALRDGIEKLKFGGEDLIFLNSSCIWDVSRLTRLLEFRIKPDALNVMTDSYQGGYHLQSYFFMIPSKYVQVTQKILAHNIKNWRVKRSVVEKGEKKLHFYWAKHGIPINVLFGAQELELRTGLDKKNTNYSKYCSEELLKLGAPFLKKSAPNFNEMNGHLGWHHENFGENA